jgi:hypothetical protein
MRRVLGEVVATQRRLALAAVVNTRLQCPHAPGALACVSLLLRKGMCAPRRCRAAMTSPSALRLLLMACASFSCCPVTSDLSTRSEPADEAPGEEAPQPQA